MPATDASPTLNGLQKNGHGHGVIVSNGDYLAVHIDFAFCFVGHWKRRYSVALFLRGAKKIYQAGYQFYNVADTSAFF